MVGFVVGVAVSMAVFIGVCVWATSTDERMRQAMEWIKAFKGQ